MNLLNVLDIVGTIVFAISGVLTAANKKFDFFGAMVIAFVTAVGGGTLRDLLMGSFPVVWIKNPIYIYVILGSVLFSLVFKKHISKWRKTMFLFDTIGIGTFTILGLQKALDFGISPTIAVLMGVISAVFGGVLRDVLCNEPPLIFRKEIYATPCILGGAIYLLLAHFAVPENIIITITAVFIISLRLLVVKKNWTLPQLS